MAIGVNSAAQLRNDSEGYSRIDFSYVAEKFNSSKSDISDLHTKGGSVAYVQGINLTTRIPLFVELGGNLTIAHGESKKSFMISDAYYERKLTMVDISVPFNIAYKIAFENSTVEIVPFFGPNFKFNVIGKMHENKQYPSSSEKTSYSFYKEDDMGDDKAQRFQFGLNLGVGFHIGNCLYFGYHIRPDVSKYADIQSAGLKYRTFTQYMTLGIYL